MTPFGRVTRGTDSRGNHKVKPDEGGRSVILLDSAGNYESGQRVKYVISYAGNFVDFSEQYSSASPHEGRPKLELSGVRVRRVERIGPSDVAAGDLYMRRALGVFDFGVIGVVGDHYFEWSGHCGVGLHRFEEDLCGVIFGKRDSSLELILGIVPREILDFFR